MCFVFAFLNKRRQTVDNRYGNRLGISAKDALGDFLISSEDFREFY